MKVLCLLFVVVFLAGCTITQEVRPVVSLDAKEVCIINNPSTREGFLEEYKSALLDKGFIVKMLSSSGKITDCHITTSYIGKWSWDLALYMSYAEIKVFQNGKMIGEAVYDSTRGGGNMSKFIDAEPKIRELVDQLYPKSS